MAIRFLCPVCGSRGLIEPAVPPFATHEICPCCGTQLGYDVTGADDIEEARGEWLASGAPWFSPLSELNPPMPEKWSLEMAKKQIEDLRDR